MPRVVQQLYHVMDRFELDDWTDGQLLDRFVECHAQAVFTRLVRRHGAMVLKVARRWLGNRQDAEDVFQATFLLLARKAASIRQQESVSGWLYAVAYRLALKVRANARRRQFCEAERAMTQTDTVSDRHDWELGEVLAEELERLPARYREALVLCYLEGLTQAEVARRLGGTPGSVNGCLKRGRELLQTRLKQRGLALAGGLAASGFAAKGAVAAVPAALVESTSLAAAQFAATLTTTGISPQVMALVQGALTTMFTTKLKKILLLFSFTLALCGTGAGLLMLPNAPAQEPAPTVGAAAAPGAAAAGPKDRYGDALPTGALHRLGSVRWRHEAECLAYSPDGTILATGGADSQIRLWDATTGMEIRRLPGHAPIDPQQLPKHNGVTGVFVHRRYSIDRGMVLSVAFSPDNKILASTGCDGMVRLWDVKTGKQLRFLAGHKECMVNSARFTAGGKQLVSGGRDGTVRVWDVATGAELRQLPGLQKISEGSFCGAVVACSSDGKTVAGGDADRILLWDVTTGKELRQIALPRRGCMHLEFSPDGKTLAAALYQKAIGLWDVGTGKILHGIPERDPVLRVAFSPDGKVIAAAVWDQTVRAYDTATGNQAFDLPSFHFHRAVAFTPDGKTLAAVKPGEPIRLWDVRAQKEDLTYGGVRRIAPTGVAWLPDGKSIVSMSHDNHLTVWDVATAKQTRQYGDKEWGLLSHPMRIMGRIALAPDGKTLAYSSYGKLRSADDPERYPILLDLNTGREIRGFKPEQKSPIGSPSWGTYNVSLSPNGKILAAVGGEDTLRLWETDTGKELRLLEGTFTNCVGDGDYEGKNPTAGFIGANIAFSPDGKLLATGFSLDNEVRIWDVDTGKMLLSCDGHRKTVRCVAFSPDGRLLATGSEDHTIRLFDPATGDQVQCLEGHQGGVRSLAFTADGKFLASGSQDGTVRLWDVTMGKEQAQFRGHQGAVDSLAFSPDGKALASGSHDNTILAWDVAAKVAPKGK
jgi:RNA polymerase sigma factor (sigma-70 family)